MHLRPTAGCEIPTLIFESKLWRGVSINIPPPELVFQLSKLIFDTLLWA
jgi:hypothetical protein